ncbi:MAG: prepilin-type N-terminal cleavage/methylation domain-containing protein [Candidatus Omnitrophota bacterium]
MKKIKKDTALARTLHTTGAFTLLELVVVIIIVGVLTSLALPRLFNAVRRAGYTEAQQMVTAISKGQFIYCGSTGQVTDDLAQLPIDLPPSAVVEGGSYYAWTRPEWVRGERVGFGLGFDPDNPEDVIQHKVGMDMVCENGEPEVVAYWWREDRPGQIGGGQLHRSYTAWSDLE